MSKFHLEMATIDAANTAGSVNCYDDQRADSTHYDQPIFRPRARVDRDAAGRGRTSAAASGALSVSDKATNDERQAPTRSRETAFRGARPQLSPACRRPAGAAVRRRLFACRRRRLVYDLSTERLRRAGGAGRQIDKAG